MESTFISKDEGGAMDENIISELTQLAKENVNFSENGLVGGAYTPVGTTWTVGAMVAQTSGLPLMLSVDGNSYGEYSEFLPGAVSLGDILEKQGYYQEIMVGSDITFGGRKAYFEQHGNYTIWDYYTAIDQYKISEDYYVWWGYEDKKLYEYAKEEITRLATMGRPFNFTMLTVDTHHISGYVCDLCENIYDVQYKNVLACASRQVNEFVSWIQTQDFYQDTTVVVVGDHLSMDNEFFQQYYDESRERRVYNCIINADVDVNYSKDRQYTTLDMFPTTLAAMGVAIEGERLGVGTNLFSNEQTLVEQYGYDYIDEEFSKTSRYYNEQILGE